jgi:hypothetical protein
MRKVAFFILTMTMTVSVFSQSAKEETIKYNKTSVPGISYETADYDVKVTTAALKNRMEKDARLKGTNMNGFRFYPAQAFAEFGNLNYDIYTKVVTTGKKKSLKTVIYLLVSKGNENFESAAKDPELSANMKAFLDNFVATYLRQFDIEQKYQAQTKLIAKLEKELKSLGSDKSKLQKQLEEKDKAIIEKQNDITKANALLNTLNQSR